MEIKHFWQKAEYLLIENVCSEDELRLCRNEIEIMSGMLEPPEKTGSAVDSNNQVRKQNKGVFFSSLFSPKYCDSSPCAKTIDKVIKAVREREYTPHSVMNYIQSGSVSYSILLSGYEAGDYYKTHHDTSTLTLLFWLKNKNFSGGDLEFTDFKEKVSFKDNSVLIFPGHYLHAVDEVISHESGFVRYVISAFLYPCGVDRKDAL